MRARIASIDSYSGHADRSELKRYVDALSGPIGKIAVVHGEEQESLAWAETLGEMKPKAEILVPQLGQIMEI